METYGYNNKKKKKITHTTRTIPRIKLVTLLNNKAWNKKHEGRHKVKHDVNVENNGTSFSNWQTLDTYTHPIQNLRAK